MSNVPEDLVLQTAMGVDGLHAAPSQLKAALPGNAHIEKQGAHIMTPPPGAILNFHPETSMCALHGHVSFGCWRHVAKPATNLTLTCPCFEITPQAHVGFCPPTIVACVAVHTARPPAHQATPKPGAILPSHPEDLHIAHQSGPTGQRARPTDCQVACPP